MLLVPVASVVLPRWSLPILPAKPVVAMETAPVPVAATADAVRAIPRAAPKATPLPVELSLYLAGLLAVLAYRAIGWTLMRRVVSRSTPLHSHLRESADVLAPVAVGIVHPVVILPANWRTWNASTRRAVFAHEFAHLRRHDAVVSAITRLAKCIFWFHPLSWWLARQISDLAEQSCDAAALERVHDPAVYSRVLLEFAGRVSMPGLAMASSSNLGARIDRVFELSQGSLRRLSRPGLLLPSLGLPIAYLIASVGLSGAPQSVAAPADTPKFEVVSIKPSTHCSDGGGGRGGGQLRSDPGMLSLDCQNVESLIQRAYLLYTSGKPFPISPTTGLPERPVYGRTLNEPIKGSPSWLSTDRYDIEAKTPSPQVREMMLGPMMQALLEDRLQLKMHRESRDVPIYELTVAKGGPKFAAAQKGACVPIDMSNPPDPDSGKPMPILCGMVHMTGDGLEMIGITMADLSKQLSGTLGRDVVDKTGLTGVYDLHAQVPPADPADPDGLAAQLTDAVQKSGLKLEPAKVSRSFLVIDHVEKPSGN
jgi:uncharacterized protein (TIGR03435 family)